MPPDGHPPADCRGRSFNAGRTDPVPTRIMVSPAGVRSESKSMVAMDPPTGPRRISAANHRAPPKPRPTSGRQRSRIRMDRRTPWRRGHLESGLLMGSTRQVTRNRTARQHEWMTVLQPLIDHLRIDAMNQRMAADPWQWKVHCMLASWRIRNSHGPKVMVAPLHIDLSMCTQTRGRVSRGRIGARRSGPVPGMGRATGEGPRLRS